MLLIAHRGGTDSFPELTIDAARHSLNSGAHYVELDIRFAKDGVPVISHDNNALKLFGNPARIADLTAEQFVSLRYVCKDHYHPHTLEDVLVSGIAPILFHVKEGGDRLVRILDIIRIHGYEDKVVMGVTTSGDVSDVKAFNDKIKVLAFAPSRKQITEFIDTDADIIRLWEEWLDEDLVRLVQASGKQVWVMSGSSAKGTVGYTTSDHILSWKRMGVDGILVDKIEQAKPLL
ncbi:glycerophosphodiester phosphodiesterase [Paenibacillus allorhizosphaerae]|uniref:GP-PDE domain-containing protein n=1 Tax=Paenibacillus allorhizosphaerae TaxID=2849866 RepID=A0ABM8VI92_9BACL|nr:glycerophosphodiester phosphodiesterase family protein [Paenibacillus allorhizosphaerae]CAG7643559.1 hypothetical protein PAECIP111802_03045 [Paenibacillus allorhizosphaerae]